MKKTKNIKFYTIYIVVGLNSVTFVGPTPMLTIWSSFFWIYILIGLDRNVYITGYSFIVIMLYILIYINITTYI